MRRVPIPAPVPPPRECVIWKPLGRRQKWNQTRDARFNRVRDAYQLTLKGIGTLSLFPNDIEDGIDEFGTLRVVCGYVSKNTCSKKMIYHTNAVSLTSFCPVVTRTTLAEDKVVWAEKATERTRPNGVHGSGLEID